MKRSITVLLLTLTTCLTAGAVVVPDPFHCIVSPADGLQGIVICPDTPSPIPYTIYTVTVRDSEDGPIINAEVVFEFPNPPDDNLRWCASANNTGFTDNDGVVTIMLRGGGYAIGANPFACRIKANGVIIREYTRVKSPDWDTGADGTVDLADLQAFFSNFPPGMAGSHDYNNDGMMDVADTIVFARAYFPVHGCSDQ